MTTPTNKQPFSHYLKTGFKNFGPYTLAKVGNGKFKLRQHSGEEIKLTSADIERIKKSAKDGTTVRLSNGLLFHLHGDGFRFDSTKGTIDTSIMSIGVNHFEQIFNSIWFD